MTQLNKNVKKQMKKKQNHIKFRNTCDVLLEGFKEDNEDFDQGKIIKKIYKVLTEHSSKLYPDQNKELFLLKNQNNEVVTIIPGLDINLVINDLNEKELDLFWGHLYVVYITSVGMVSLINNNKKTEKGFEIIPKLKEKVIKMGLLNDILNSYVGVVQTTSEYDINNMYENVEKIKEFNGQDIEQMGIKAAAKLAGFDTELPDVSKLTEQLQNMGESEIKDATNTITTLLGTNGNSDATDTCNVLVSGIVNHLKENPEFSFENIIKTAQVVKEQVESTVGAEKMATTKGFVKNFMDNHENTLKNMKDADGKDIDDNLMKSLEGPLQMMKEMKNGKMPNMGDLFKQFGNLKGIMNKGNKK